jgi:transposase
MTLKASGKITLKFSANGKELVQSTERMAKRYHVRLSATEREELNQLIRKGKAAANKQLHARILLHADEEAQGGGWQDNEIAEALKINVRTVERVRERFVQEGLKAALEKRARVNPPRERKLDGKAEAIMIAQACGPAPEGHCRWTLKLLANRLVELEVVEAISDQTVGRALKKMSSSLG